MKTDRETNRYEDYAGEIDIVLIYSLQINHDGYKILQPRFTLVELIVVIALWNSATIGVSSYQNIPTNKTDKN
jgi:hypothetical protein